MVCWVVEVALRYTCTASRSARKSWPTLTRPKLTPFNSRVKCYFTHPRNHWKWNKSQRGIPMSGKGKSSFGGSVLSVSICCDCLNKNTDRRVCFPVPWKLEVPTQSSTPEFVVSWYFPPSFRTENIDRKFLRSQVCLGHEGSAVGRVLGWK